MKVVHRGKLRHVVFTFAVGDLFDAEVDAIVNSEQTDFILSGNHDSISGQIRHRYGHRIQEELNALANGQVLGAGTVLETSGGRDFKRIFHAGFHDPDDRRTWCTQAAIARTRDARETDYFEAIGSCIAQVLDRVKAQKLESVAFPLIGCGRFGLDEKMLIQQFLRAVQSFDDRLPDGEGLDIWLVIRDRSQFESIAGRFLDLLLQVQREMARIQLPRSGVPIMDRFAVRLSEPATEEWVKWQLCRNAEIATEIMCYGLSLASRPAKMPETLFEEGQAPTFGLVCERARELAVAIDAEVWGARFFAGVIRDEAAGRALDKITAARNNLAHGRKSMPLANIQQLCRA
jgi:O-acetyl-ADP-ribose deacetylase (regulator of RNase III)